MMLIEGAIKFAEQGKTGLVSGDFEQAYNGISQCRQIGHSFDLRALVSVPFITG